ncbi:MAG: ABC transporter permease [Acidimicrobiia bacterium]
MSTTLDLPAREGRVRGYLRLYATLFRIAMLEQFQYRAANYFYMIGMVTEPVIYLVVWSTIAEEQGGSLEGYTPARFAAYYIVWTLVRNMNIVFTPFGWEERIREGQLSAQLARPVHPIHYDLGLFAGWKVVAIVLWLPIAAVLALLFRPDLAPRPTQVAAFAVAIWGAYLIRSFLLWILGMVTFWTTRVGALFEAFFAAELLLSGRLVPVALMPEWAQTLTAYLPFQWTFGFPITALVGPITDRELLIGLANQAGWILFGMLAVKLMWGRAVKTYTAVSG